MKPQKPYTQPDVDDEYTLARWQAAFPTDEFKDNDFRKLRYYHDVLHKKRFPRKHENQ